MKGIEALVAVHRLREVVCLYGFTRFESSPPMSDDGLEDIGLAVRVRRSAVTRSGCRRLSSTARVCSSRSMPVRSRPGWIGPTPGRT